ncbi:MAG: hypothetical protein IPO07_12015 [Haliscomenobacter sp.]|nr:hypothetical protein [Haliscomenobacter sp.]MBK9489422.1 hypothetical protein [Haliscomenobacter sp.]
MKNKNVILILLLILGSLWSFSACQPNNKEAESAQKELDQAGENLKDAAQDTKEALRIERDALATELRRQGEEIDQAIAELDKKWKKPPPKKKFVGKSAVVHLNATVWPFKKTSTRWAKTSKKVGLNSKMTLHTAWSVSPTTSRQTRTSGKGIK